ncbi:MAG: universal stress protein [Cyclobacteriaceae bacterium]|nr:universal stress protein [Cyclobacteriaceae bacterium]
MKKILVPTDFSEKADFALEVACKLADKSGAEVILLHVVESASHSATSFTGQMNFGSAEEEIFTLKLIEKGKQEIEMRKQDPLFIGDNWRSEIQVGNAFHGIRNIINAQKVDLVVMGTSGVSGFDEMMIGSTAEKVVRYSKCPVITIHKKQTSFDYDNIVFATALQDEELMVLNLVQKIQKYYDSKIHLVRINTPNNFERDIDSFDALKKFAERANLTNYTTNVFNDITEEEGIIYFAEHINADMIAMSTHGRTGLAHLLSGSIAEDVVNQANRPVLTSVINE